MNVKFFKGIIWKTQWGFSARLEKGPSGAGVMIFKRSPCGQGGQALLEARGNKRFGFVIQCCDAVSLGCELQDTLVTGFEWSGDGRILVFCQVVFHGSSSHLNSTRNAAKNAVCGVQVVVGVQWRVEATPLLSPSCPDRGPPWREGFHSQA